MKAELACPVCQCLRVLTLLDELGSAFHARCGTSAMIGAHAIGTGDKMGIVVSLERSVKN
jgi:hypothetical protein